MGAIFDPLLGQLRSDVAGSFSGILPVAKGGTGSATQNFVDLSSTQTVGGAKTFTTAITITAAGNSFTANDTSTPSSTGGTGMLGGLTQNPTAAGQRLGYFLFKSPIANSTGMMAFTTEAHSSGHAGTYLSFWTTPTASTGRLIALQLGSDQTVTTYGNVGPNANNSYNLGGSGTYWSNLYATTHFYNSTASMTGSTAGQIKTTGLFMPVQAATASAPSYVKGAMYFDTTANKLMIGGAAAWETVSSS